MDEVESPGKKSSDEKRFERVFGNRKDRAGCRIACEHEGLARVRCGGRRGLALILFE